MQTKWIWIGGSAIFLAFLGGAFNLPSTRNMVLAMFQREPAPKMAVASATSTAPTIVTETAIADAGVILGSAVNSWPGEIVSKGDVDVYPNREGHITEWNVQIGERVVKGQVLGRLSPQSATLELASALAERAAALARARTKVTANEAYVEQAKQRLRTVKQTLVASRDAAIQLAERDAERDRRSSAGANNELVAERASRDAAMRSAETDLEQTRTFLPIKRQTARVAIERLAQRVGGKFALSGTSPITPAEAQAMEFRRTIGILNAAGRDAYRRALSNLLLTLKDPQALPETASLEYARAGLALLSSSLSSDDLSATELNDLRTDLTDDQKDFYDALKDYKDTQRSLAVKEANLSKLIADRDRDVTIADTQALVAGLTAESADSYKRKTAAEAEVEFAKEQAELDTTLSNLQRDLELAHGEVRAAEAAYGTVAGGVAGQEITAPLSGIVSAILQRNGDHVTTENAIASLSQSGATMKFVRFRIPSNLPKPEAGIAVRIERPGYSLEKAQGTIMGVGGSLDSSGSYMAEAMFDEDIDWPVHASVRVSLVDQAPSVSLPLSAIWWTSEGQPQVWLATSSTTFMAQTITVGRVLGDRAEILEGVKPGMKYLPKLDAETKKMATFLYTSGTPMVDHAALSGQADEEATPHKKKIGTDMHGGMGM